MERSALCNSKRLRRRERSDEFLSRVLYAVLFASSFAVSAAAQSTATPPPPEPRHITLSEAVQLALKHNHFARIAGFKVDEMKDAKDVARSAYLPSIKNE